MLQRITLIICLLLAGCLSAMEPPVSYKGRFRPMDVYAKLFLNMEAKSIWDIHFNGHKMWDTAPLFPIQNKKLKKLYRLNPKGKKFSYEQLKETPHRLMMELIPYFYWNAYNSPVNRSRETRLELSQLEPDLWVNLEEGYLIVEKDGTRIASKNAGDQSVAEEFLSLRQILREYETIDPLMLPSRETGVWLPISTLKETKNKTLYPDPLYASLKKAYDSKNIPVLKQHLIKGYHSIEETPYREAFGKKLVYPTLNQLSAESFYYRYPLNLFILGVYAVGALAILLGAPRLGVYAILLAFVQHTALLGLRCYILGRPPVSNMFETLVYVPWISVLASLLIYPFFKNRILLLASSLCAVILLALLQITRLDSSMENVQAVLDSQFWLIIHVLMVVGSYGLFILAGILGHIYLVQGFSQGEDSPVMDQVSKLTLQSIYIGTTLLISGTILGGVWAAQSWGRFWDWDPKESWAFISSCIYLIQIHLIRFRYIGNYGLAVGSIIGLGAISFTWYGVNYILGTGLHSYGFGYGGEFYYFLYLLAEALFLLFSYTKKLIKIG